MKGGILAVRLMKNNRGVTLIELVVVVAIVAILAVALGFQYAGWQGRYKTESQVREIYSTLMKARADAMDMKKPYRVTFGTNAYQVFQATDESGTAFMPAPGWATAKGFNYPASWTGTVEFDGRGLAMQPPTVWVGSGFDIKFAQPGVDADYDCVKIEPTRTSLGKWSTTCDVK